MLPFWCFGLHVEFDIKGEAYSTPLTCIDAPFHDNGIITEMPIFLRGVSIHPLHQTQHPIPFDDQFSDTTPFTHNATVSLDFPTIISLATTRFFRKCFATAQAGHTVILIGGFRDKPSNRKIRNRLSRISSAAHHHTHTPYSLFHLIPFPLEQYGDGPSLPMTIIISITDIHSTHGLESPLNL